MSMTQEELQTLLSEEIPLLTSQAGPDAVYEHRCGEDEVASAAYILAELHREAGESLQQNGSWEEALSHYNRALQRWPRHTSVHHEKATLLSSLGWCPEATEAMRAAVDSGPSLDSMPSWATCHLCNARLTSMQLAKYHLSVLQCQMGDPAADQGLRELGYEWRLSKEVFEASRQSSSRHRRQCSKEAVEATGRSENAVSVYRSVLGDEMLRRLREAFAERSPSSSSSSSSSCLDGDSFWSAHRYDDPETVYFSYYYHLHPPEAPPGARPAEASNPASNLVEQTIQSLYTMLLSHHPSLALCHGAEWWVHKRRHGDAHQLHYDTDENFLKKDGRVRHPLLSSVLFLSSCGGPLLVANQVLGEGNVDRKGWLVAPHRNHMACFQGGGPLSRPICSLSAHL